MPVIHGSDEIEAAGKALDLAFDFTETGNRKAESGKRKACSRLLKTDGFIVAPDVIRGPASFLLKSRKLVPALPLTAENGKRKPESVFSITENLNLKTEN